MQRVRSRENQSQRGGAALEYILVSTFAAALCMAALSFIGQSVQAKLRDLADKLGSDAVPEEFDWLKKDP